MAKRFLRPMLALTFLTVGLGINFWWLAGEGFVYRLPNQNQVQKATFCRCLADGNACWDQDSRYSDEELNRWEKLVESDPAYPDGWAKLSTVWFYKGRRDLAIMTIEQAVWLAPFRQDLKKLEKRIKNACG